MNILFLTLLDFSTIKERGIYSDLMREFAANGHRLFIVSPTERRHNKPIEVIEEASVKILKLRIGNSQKTHIIEKGLTYMGLERAFIKGIKTHFKNVKFDLVLYSTPPITLQKSVTYIKKRDGAKTYLLLKDIFPQNAVDLGMMKKSGITGGLYRYFRNKEKKLYRHSDHIGCMSQANVQYVLDHNPEVGASKIEVCPNSLSPVPVIKDEAKRERTRQIYRIPLNKTVFLYGGNLGKPQGIDFLLECLQANEHNGRGHFVIVGSGTEFNRVQNWFQEKKPMHAKLINQLSKEAYDELVKVCDVGLIYLDRKFTIPNFPSRLLSYMMYAMPVLAATDTHTDIGKVLEEGGFGRWCESGNLEAFMAMFDEMCDGETRQLKGLRSRSYLEEHYTAKQSYDIIMDHLR